MSNQSTKTARLLLGVALTSLLLVTACDRQGERLERAREIAEASIKQISGETVVDKAETPDPMRSVPIEARAIAGKVVSDITGRPTDKPAFALLSVVAKPADIAPAEAMAEIEDLQITYPGAGTFKFGDSAEMSLELINLVRAGKKRATCGALSDFDDEPEAMPVVGRTDIVAHWDGTPALVIKTVRVQQVRFCDVTKNMALAEGENDTLEGWRKGHKAFFKRNGGYDPEMMLVFESFELVEDLAGREL